MIKKMIYRIVLISVLALLNVELRAQDWIAVQDGIEKTVISNDIWVYKLDQNKIKFRAIGDTARLRPVNFYVHQAEALGGINLNMWSDGFLPNGYFKKDGQVINPKLINYNLFVVWDNDTLRIMDRTVESMDEILSYPNVSQNIRMITAEEDYSKRNRWQVDQKKWSVATIATTTEGDVLYIHSRYPYTMHEFIDILLDEGAFLNIYRMAYLEGGPESSILIDDGSKKSWQTSAGSNQRMGSYETGFNENENVTHFWDIPWVLLIEKK